MGKQVSGALGFGCEWEAFGEDCEIELLLCTAFEFLCVLLSPGEMVSRCAILAACGGASRQTRCWSHSCDTDRREK